MIGEHTIRRASTLACATLLWQLATPGASTAGETPAGGPAPASGDDTSAGERGDDERAPGTRLRLAETLVQADRPFTAASSRVVRGRDLALRPIRRPADILEVAPGLAVVQHAGGGKANQYLLRGFDADHGTDVALTIDGVPVNNPTHAHGQGYADLNFVIPEVVERVEVDKGPYFVEHGDFATAGAVNLVTRRAAAENSATFQAGRFDIFRGLVIGGGELAGADTLLAVEGYGQDGPFENPEDYTRYNLFARAGVERDDRGGDLTFTSYRGSWNASGQIPLRAVRAGTLDRFGSVDPTEGGTSQRHQLYGRAWWRPDADTEARLLAYGAYYDLDLFSNFTFFARDPENGDQIEQKDKRFFGGGEARLAHRLRLGRRGVELAGALGLRGDNIANQLSYTRARRFLSPVTDHNVGQVDAYGWVRADVTWTPWLRTLVGLRLDDLYLDVDNDLQQATDPELRGQGTEHELVVSPKASVVLSPFTESSRLAATQLFVNYGEGFHSNDARGVVRTQDPVDPTAKARGGELGARTRLLDRLDLAAALWLLDLESEIVFVGDEGTTEPSGATRRWGGELEARLHILDWLFLDLDYTRTVARFRFAPDGEDRVPLSPRWTLAGGLAARRDDGLFGSLRVRAISSRPANEDGSLEAAGYTVWDLQLGKTWELPRWRIGDRAVRLTARIDLINLFDRDYREAQFATTSRLPGEAAPVEDIGFTPGYPLTAIGSLTVAF
jgi:outer membrane receptor protein involved in Fe transport